MIVWYWCHSVQLLGAAMFWFWRAIAGPLQGHWTEWRKDQKISNGLSFSHMNFLKKNGLLATLISLINLKSRLLILKKKIHPPCNFSPSMFIDFLDFFHPPLLIYCSYCIYVLVFSKKSHPPCLFILQLLHPLPRSFQPPRLLERWE